MHYDKFNCYSLSHCFIMVLRNSKLSLERYLFGLLMPENCLKIVLVRNINNIKSKAIGIGEYDQE